MQRLILILIVTFSVISCGEKIVYVQQPLMLPPPLELPAIRAGVFQCAPEESFNNLAIGINLMTNRIETLQNIIKSTQVTE